MFQGWTWWAAEIKGQALPGIHVLEGRLATWELPTLKQTRGAWGMGQCSEEGKEGGNMLSWG